MSKKYYIQCCENINDMQRSINDLKELEKVYYKNMEEIHTKEEWNIMMRKLKKQMALVLKELFSSLFGDISLGTNDSAEYGDYIEITKFFKKHKNEINNYVDIYFIEFFIITLGERRS